MNPYKNVLGQKKTIFCFLESQPTKAYALSEPVLFATVKYFPPIISAPKKNNFFFLRYAPSLYQLLKFILHVGHFVLEKKPNSTKKYGVLEVKTIYAYESIQKCCKYWARENYFLFLEKPTHKNICPV